MGLSALLENPRIKARTHQESHIQFCDVPLARSIGTLQYVQWMVTRKQTDETRETWELGCCFPEEYDDGLLFKGLSYGRGRRILYSK